MKATSSRRQIIVAVLLVLAIIGAAMRVGAPKPSLARDIGTLLLVLWLPVIGNIIGFVIGRVARMRQRHAFAPGAAFTPHLLAELSARPGQVRLKREQRRCTLVIGNEGFTARLAAPLSQWLAAAQPRSVELELLRPEIALPRFTPGAEFTLHAGAATLGSGRVLQVLMRPAA
jgi:hypothetical protein